jgi:hypothetical protein
MVLRQVHFPTLLPFSPGSHRSLDYYHIWTYNPRFYSFLGHYSHGIPSQLHHRLLSSKVKIHAHLSQSGIASFPLKFQRCALSENVVFTSLTACRYQFNGIREPSSQDPHHRSTLTCCMQEPRWASMAYTTERYLGHYTPELPLHFKEFNLPSMLEVSACFSRNLLFEPRCLKCFSA